MRGVLVVLWTVAALLGVGAADAGVARADDPFARKEATPASVVRPATDSPRLRAVAAALGRDPLYVDPELGWTMRARERRTLRAALRRARVPVLVAVLPSIDEDESGGDSKRTLQALQRLVRRDAVYVTADQRGWFDVASMGIPLDLSIPFSLTMPPSRWSTTGDEDREPAPGYTSLPDRLERMLRYVAVAEPGTPNGPIDHVGPLAELSSTRGYDVSEDVVAASIMGGILGLSAAGVVLGIRRIVRSRSAHTGPRNPQGGPPRPGGAAGRSEPGRPADRGRRRGGRRRRRRGA